MTLSHGAVHYPFCFTLPTRLALLTSLAELSTLSTGVFRSYFHAFHLSRVWFYSVDARNHLKLMEIVSHLHNHLSLIHHTLVTALTEIPITQNTTYVVQDHTNTGAFVATEILLRKSFPEIPEALTDKGLLRALLRDVFPRDATVADLGALDGQYSRWLNDTGLVQAFAFDGIENVETLTNGRVNFFDLSDETSGPSGPFDFVLCLEVAEHVANETAFMAHLKRLSNRVIISWSASSEEGVGHVNPKTPGEVEAVMGDYGFRINWGVTDILRDAATIPWIKESVSFYEA